MDMKDKIKKDLYDEVKEMHYNQGLSHKELAIHFGKSLRTIYRWLKCVNQENSLVSQNSKKESGRPKKYPSIIFNRIVELKEELPQRSEKPKNLCGR